MSKLPTLFRKGMFKFYDKVKDVPLDILNNLENTTAIEVLLKVLDTKYNTAPSIFRNIYFLKAGTGSSKSTGFVSNLFKQLCTQQGERVIVTEPRVNLAISNAQDIIRYNNDLIFGLNVGVLTGDIKIECKSRKACFYCTPQILLNKMVSEMLDPDNLDHFHYKYIVIDEVHTVDTPMISMLKVIKEYVKKFCHRQDSPIFILTSATLDMESFVKYFFETPEQIEQVYTSWLAIADVPGLGSNYNREERFLSNDLCKQLNEKLNKGDNVSYQMADYYMENALSIDGDALIICPTARILEDVGSRMFEKITNLPTLLINKGDPWTKVLAWRTKYRGQKRIIIIRYGKNYSPASDTLMLYARDPDDEAYENEKKIMISTPIVETGKTFSKLTYAIDLGIQTLPCYEPLTYFYGKRIINQVPENMTQVIQRRGRVGRECDGIFQHFFSKEACDQLDPIDVPATINNFVLSYMLAMNLSICNVKLGNVIDLMQLNDYVYKISFDIMIKSIHDLIHTNIYSTFGEVVDYNGRLKTLEQKIIMIELLFYVFGYSLFNAALTIFVNEYEIPFSFGFDRVPKFSITVDKLTKDNIYEIKQYKNIAKARQLVSKVMYSEQFRQFPYLKNRMFEKPKEHQEFPKKDRPRDHAKH